MDVLKYRPPVLSKTKSLFRPRDLRCCHVTNKCHRFPSSTFLVDFDKFSRNFFLYSFIAFIDLPLGTETCIASPLDVTNMACTTFFTLVILLAIQGLLAFLASHSVIL